MPPLLALTHGDGSLGSWQGGWAISADEVARQLQAGVGAGRLLSARGSVLVEVRTNQLFVTDIPSRLEQVQELLRKIDIPVRQVMIEARIVEADDNFSRSLGVRLGGSDLRGVRGGDALLVKGSNSVGLGAIVRSLAAREQ